MHHCGAGIERESRAGIRHARRRPPPVLAPSCVRGARRSAEPAAVRSRGATLPGDNHVERSFWDIAAAERGVPVAVARTAERDSGTRRSGQQRRCDGRRPAALRAPRGSARGSRFADGREAPRRARRQRRGAAMLGGLVTTCVRGDDGTVIARAVPWPEGIRFVVASPAVRLATSESRRVLPAALPLADAVFNLQRALLSCRHSSTAPAPSCARPCATNGTSRSGRRSCRGSQSPSCAIRTCSAFA